MHLSTTLSIRPRAAAPGKAPAADDWRLLGRQLRRVLYDYFADGSLK